MRLRFGARRHGPIGAYRHTPDCDYSLKLNFVAEADFLKKGLFEGLHKAGLKT